MVNTSYTAIVERNVSWEGSFSTEPYECGWAKEAIFFIRALDAAAGAASGEARIQISPDGMRWIDEGSVFSLPEAADQATFCRVSHFGNWLRVAGNTGTRKLRVLVTLHLKA
jgi:hypothetical protein